jgi:hypothetical protein
MKRRDFVSRVTLGAAVACTGLARQATAAPSGSTTVRFVGMMTFVERTDRSFLVATPGQHAMHHITHVPFLMARRGSPIAKALNMVPVMGVVPAAFDTQLIGTNPGEFVYRSLANTSIEVVAGANNAVHNASAQMAMLQQIAPGKRLRGNVEKWATTTIDLRGGRLDDSAAHPDAGRVWSFGDYKQRVTDAVNFSSKEAVSIRLTSGTEVSSYSAAAGDTSELWVMSAATMDSRSGDPTELTHTDVLLDYLVDAKPVHALCPDATGRDVPATVIPFANGNTASIGVMGREATFPPMVEVCILACILLGSDA